MYLLVIRIVLCARVECGHNVCVMCDVRGTDVLLPMLSSISTWQQWLRRSTPRLPSGPEKITYSRKINKNNISIIHHICHQIAPIFGPGQHHNKHQGVRVRRESNKYTHSHVLLLLGSAHSNESLNRGDGIFAFGFVFKFYYTWIKHTYTILVVDVGCRTRTKDAAWHRRSRTSVMAATLSK